jgi:hypothetical protein
MQAAAAAVHILDLIQIHNQVLVGLAEVELVDRVLEVAEPAMVLTVPQILVAVEVAQHDLVKL